MPRHGRFVTLRLAAAVAVTASLTAALAASGPAFPTAYAATVAPTRLCAGDDWGGPANANPWRHLDAGYVSVYGKPAVRVILAGRVDWGANPYSNAKWQAWFMSLKWLGDYYNKSAGRMGIDMHTPTHAERIAFLESALSITAQYAAFSSGPRTAAQIAAQQATDGHRALAIVCLAEQDEILNGSVRPWLTSLIGTELATLISRQRRLPWNQTVEDMLPVLTAGCLLGNQDWTDTATRLLDEVSLTNIDSEGATVEQSLGYANYNLRLWPRVQLKYERCMLGAPANLRERLDLLAAFMTAGTTPDGTLEQLGESTSQVSSYAVLPDNASFAWAKSRGATGQAPPKEAVYTAGYVFGRPTGTFDGDFYTVRFGPARNFHGQREATSFTWWPSGRPLVVDTGYPGFSDAARRAYQSAVYQNGITITGVNAGIEGSRASTLSTVPATFGPSYSMSHPYPWTHTVHKRELGFVPDLDAVVVRDYTYNDRHSVTTSQNLRIAAGYRVTVGPGNIFRIKSGSITRFVGYTFGPAGRRLSVAAATQYVTNTTTRALTTMVQSSTGRRATLGLIIVPSGTSVTWATDATGVVATLTRGSTVRQVRVGANLT